MSDAKELNSTERLLHSIRMANEDEPLQMLEENELPSAVSNKMEQKTVRSVGIEKGSSHRKIAHRKGTLGVFIESDCIALALAEGKGVQSRNLVKWALVGLPDGVGLESDRFPGFLKSSLSDFVGKIGKLEIWTSISPKNLKVRHFTIPVLPESKKANAVFWGMKKEVEIDSSSEVFDFQPLGEVFESGARKEKVLGFAAPKDEISLLKKVFSKAGYPLTGISALPFALGNFIRAGVTDLTQETYFSIVNIAREYTEISCFKGSELLLVRNIKTGSLSLSEDMDPSSMERLAGKIARTSDYCSNQYAENVPLSVNLFFGETDDSQKFMDFAEGYIDAQVLRFDPFANHLLQPGILVPPESARQRSGIVPAFGLAHSVPGHTPNFLFTHVHRKRKQKYRRMNIAIAASFLVCMALCTGAYLWQAGTLKSELSKKRTLDKELSAYSPKADNAMIAQRLASVRKRTETRNAYVTSIEPLGVVNELFALTPGTISLISLDAAFGSMPEKGASGTAEAANSKNAKEKKAAERILVTKGFVEGEYTSLESELTGYLLRLGDSSLFGNISVVSREVGKYQGIAGDVLKFTISLEIL